MDDGRDQPRGGEEGALVDRAGRGSVRLTGAHVHHEFVAKALKR
jgi:hypothetical protein